MSVQINTQYMTLGINKVPFEEAVGLDEETWNEFEQAIQTQVYDTYGTNQEWLYLGCKMPIGVMKFQFINVTNANHKKWFYNNTKDKQDLMLNLEQIGKKYGMHLLYDDFYKDPHGDEKWTVTFVNIKHPKFVS